MPRSSGPLALIVAAGRGQRFGSELPKQYHRLGDHRVLTETLVRLFDASRCRAVVVTIHPDFQDQAKAALDDLPHNLADACQLVAGGSSRQESVRLGLQALSAAHPTNTERQAGTELADLVLIHDAARPLLTACVADRLIAAALEVGASVPVLPVADTLKRLDDQQRIAATVDRSALMRVQTPQVFALARILEAHQRLEHHRDLTDDASLFETLGWPVASVPGDERLLKITSQSDLEMVRALQTL